MTTLQWIILSGLLMSAIALVGIVTLLLRPATLDRLLLPLVALAAGSLIGGAFFHLIPEAVEATGSVLGVGIAVTGGFLSVFVLEQFLHWHRCRRGEGDHSHPVTWLILIGDGLHNFLDGLAIASAFLLDVRLGITSWLAAAAHEIPQELGDFGVLVHGGWSKRRALLFNALSGLAFLAGGLLTYGLSDRIDVTWLIPFAAGNFIYMGATDLVPEVNKEQSLGRGVLHLLAFVAGLGAMLLVRLFH